MRKRSVPNTKGSPGCPAPLHTQTLFMVMQMTLGRDRRSRMRCEAHRSITATRPLTVRQQMVGKGTCSEYFEVDRQCRSSCIR